MELGINLVLLAGFALAWMALTPGEIHADFPRSNAQRLGALERRLHESPDDVPLLHELSTSYLAARRPGAAVAVLHSVREETAAEYPALGRTLAESYEAMGRFDDALAIASLTLDRCIGALGAGIRGTAVPRVRCTAREYARLSVLEEALRYVVAWGIVRLDDRRIGQAYDFALPRTRMSLNESANGQVLTL